MIAFVFLIACLPLLALIAVLIRIFMGPPIFFRQQRPGINGQPFTLVKFRTMLADCSLPESQRVTPLGRFLRRWSLDELPELWNVLCGEMSLIGPRPLLMEYLDRYSPEQRRRNEVLPGITGWAQVNGRNAISWEQKFELDLWYVNHRSLRLDLKILALTAVQVLRRAEVNQSSEKSMEEFAASRGNSQYRSR